MSSSTSNTPSSQNNYQRKKMLSNDLMVTERPCRFDQFWNAKSSPTRFWDAY